MTNLSLHPHDAINSHTLWCCLTTHPGDLGLLAMSWLHRHSLPIWFVSLEPRGFLGLLSPGHSVGEVMTKLNAVQAHVLLQSTHAQMHNDINPNSVVSVCGQVAPHCMLGIFNKAVPQIVGTYIPPPTSLLY